jgi:hypothetical protein
VHTDAFAPVDARSDVAKPDAGGKPDAGFECVPSCTTDEECVTSCPSVLGTNTYCCDGVTGVCFGTASATCPAPSPGFDAGGPCAPGCKSNEDCMNTCPQEFETGYCCDVTTGLCFVSFDPSCPLAPPPVDSGLGGCLLTGCPSGQMCIAFTELDPPEEPQPSCYAVPAACRSNPTCPCLADAGACGPPSLGFTPSCTGTDGAVVGCFPAGL